MRVPPGGTPDESYDIVIGRGLLREVPRLVAAACPAARYFVISDSNVTRLYGITLLERLRTAQLSAELLTMPSGEAGKTRDNWSALTDVMLTHAAGRDSAVIALGGGVVGDLAGFVAATFMRGIPYVHVPTTLLAMIDASIGGKTGVDAPAGKNLVGAFHNPRVVIQDLDALDTLSPEGLASGVAEAVKHGVVADAAYFGMLERDHERVTARDKPVLERVVGRSVEIKVAIVAADAHERGRRATLNFGHTVGHAIEAARAYDLPHGAAVAAGMVIEARLGERLGVTEPGTSQRIAGTVRAFGLPDKPPQCPAEALMAAMRHDKKVRAGAVRFALPARIGEMHAPDAETWTTAVPEGLLREVIAGPG